MRALQKRASEEPIAALAAAADRLQPITGASDATLISTESALISDGAEKHRRPRRSAKRDYQQLCAPFLPSGDGKADSSQVACLCIADAAPECALCRESCDPEAAAPKSAAEQRDRRGQSAAPASGLSVTVPSGGASCQRARLQSRTRRKSARLGPPHGRILALGARLARRARLAGSARGSPGAHPMPHRAVPA